MQAVNLLPRELTPERAPVKEVLPVLAAASVPLAAAMLIVIGYASAHADAKEQLGRVAALQFEVAHTKPLAARTALDTSSLVSSRAARRSALASAVGKEVAWDRTLGDVARVLPATVWLTDMTVSSPTPADSAVPVTPTPAPSTGPSSGDSGFTINGYTYTMEDVALVLQRLQLLPTLSNVTLGSTSRSTIGTKNVVQFSITAAMVAPATTATAPPPLTAVPAEAQT
jgi:Tfp pilus assembly protein PilN